MSGGAGNDGEWSYTYIRSQNKQQGSHKSENAQSRRQQAPQTHPAGAPISINCCSKKLLLDCPGTLGNGWPC